MVVSVSFGVPVGSKLIVGFGGAIRTRKMESQGHAGWMPWCNVPLGKRLREARGYGSTGLAVCLTLGIDLEFTDRKRHPMWPELPLAEFASVWGSQKSGEFGDMPERPGY
jgi:hypothetical protein